MRPTRSTASAAARRTSTPPPTSATSATTAATPAATRGPPLDVAAREIELHGLDGRAFTLAHAGGRRRVPTRAARALQRLQRARGGRDSRSRSASSLDDVVAGLGRVHGGVRTLRADRGRRPRPAPAADQEPGRRERGGADARRRRRLPTLVVIALNDAIADGRDVSWIWDVDFEPLLDAGSSGSSRRATARPSSRCASPTAGFAARADRGRPGPRAALDRGLELTPPRRRARRPPHLHRDARAARDRGRARARAGRTGSRTA